MRKATLTRLESGDQGTFGLLETPGFKCVTLELPWRGNIKGFSCVPVGTYVFKWRTDSPKHGEVYEMEPDEEAPDRDNVQIHPANLAGDVDKGYVSQLLGCLALGKDIAMFKAAVKPAGIKEQKGITDSKAMVKAFVQKMNIEPFELTIK